MTPVPNAAAVDQVFANLIAGVRACGPKCADCNGPLNRDTTGIYQRQADTGAQETLCRACFIGELAEQLTGNAPS